jgi:hypothetical protein
MRGPSDTADHPASDNPFEVFCYLDKAPQSGTDGSQEGGLRHLTYDSRNGLFTLDFIFIQITIVARHVQYMTGASISFV